MTITKQSYQKQRRCSRLVKRYGFNGQPIHKEDYRRRHRITRLLHRYLACHAYCDQNQGTGLNMAWYAAMSTLEATVWMLQVKENVPMGWDYIHDHSLADIQYAWEELTSADAKAVLSSKTVKKVHCLTCGG